MPPHGANEAYFSSKCFFSLTYARSSASAGAGFHSVIGSRSPKAGVVGRYSGRPACGASNGQTERRSVMRATKSMIRQHSMPKGR